MRYNWLLGLGVVILTTISASSATISVNNSQELQKALKDDKYDLIILEPGTYVGNFILQRGDVAIIKTDDFSGNITLIQETPEKPLFLINQSLIDSLKPGYKLSNIDIEDLNFVCTSESDTPCIKIIGIKKSHFYNNIINSSYGMLVKDSQIAIEKKTF